MNHPLVTIMIGNTHTSCLGWSMEGVAGDAMNWLTDDAESAHEKSVSNFYEPLTRLAKPDAMVILGSVVPDYQPLLRGWLLDHGFGVTTFRSDVIPQIEIVPQPPQNVGDDRIAGALGALVLYPTTPAVVVDAGTALTVNAVKPGLSGAQPRFEGGVIIPGQQAMLAALAGNAAQLPIVEPHSKSEAADFVGHSTEEAMQLGAWHAYSAGAVFVAIRQAAALGDGTRVLLTGGGAQALEVAFKQLPSKYSVEVQPQLVHRGLFAAFQESAS